VNAPIKPFKNQVFSIKHNDKTPIVFDTSDAGTGKTYVRIMGFAKRRAKGGGCLLVIGTRSTLRTVWQADFRKFAPHLKAVVAPAEKREEAFAIEADVYITNHDATTWLAKQKPAFFKRFTELAIDESDAFKHYTSTRSRALLKIVKHFKYRCCMTATPASRTIVDVFHQALLLDGGKRLGKLYTQFRSAVATPIKNAHGNIEWHDKEGAEEAVFALLADITVRHRLDDCADIPENHQYPLAYELTTSQKAAYMELEASKVLELKASKVTAINAAAVATKLQQVASGAVYSSPDKYHVVDRSRYELILDLCAQRVHPLVLFQWKHQRDLLVEEAKKRGMTYEIFDGEVTDRERLRIVQSYQAGLIDVLFAQPKSIGHGHTLTRGKSTIWASPTHDTSIFIQASSRQRRIGQTEKTETIVVIAEGTIDEWVYDNCMTKGARMDSLLDLFAHETAVLSNIPVKRKTKATA
jgi:SNF2 family DNA or RNA helicase